MKQVTVPKDITFASNVSHDKYYGISPYKGRTDRNGFITREKYGSGLYIGRCGAALTKGNDWDYKNTSLVALVQDFIAADFQVFEFDTQKELFAWLAS